MITHAALAKADADFYTDHRLQEVACSINATNQGLPLLVMTVAGDLSPAIEAQAARAGRVVHVPDLNLPNSMRDGR